MCESSYSKVRLFFILLQISITLNLSAEGIKGINNQIRFDVEDNASIEMILNTDGLGIGVIPTANLHVSGNAIVSNSLKVGTISGSSNLEVGGTVGFGFEAITSDATLGDSSLVLVDSASDNIKVTLPYAGNVTGRIYTIKRTSSENRVWLYSDNLIDSFSSVGLDSSSSSLGSIEIISDGSTWYSLSRHSIAELWTPASVTTSIWLDADDSTTVTANVSNSVEAWSDKSGNSNDFVQSNSTYKPTLTTANGRSAIYFSVSGNTSMTSTSSLQDVVSSDNLFSIYLALPSSSDARGLFHARGTARVQIRDSNQWMIGTYSGGDPGIATSANILGGMQRDINGDVSYSVDGTFSANVYNDAVSLQDGTTLKIGESDGLRHTGHVGELVAFPSHLSTEVRLKLEGYLAHKWGFLDNLPSDHLYKVIPPYE